MTAEGAYRGPGAPSPSRSTYDGLSFTKYMVAGGAAGIVEHTAMFPVDTIKTRMQALSQPGQQLLSNKVSRAFRAILKREGAMGLYRGCSAMVIGAGPSHGIYFAVYEGMKEFLGANADGHWPLQTGLAAASGTIISDGVMTPLDVVKQRLQLAHSPYKGILDCVTKTIRNEGIGAFYRSYQTTLVMNIPFMCIHFASYESSKKLLRESAESEGLLTQIVAGGIAGGAAALATNPLDVVKTRLQTEGVISATRYRTSSFYRVLRDIVQNEGPKTLLKGIRPRVFFHIPAAAISWVTYETCKKLL